MRGRSPGTVRARGALAVLALYGLLLQGLLASFLPVEARSATAFALCSPGHAPASGPDGQSPHAERCCAALCGAGAAPPPPGVSHLVAEPPFDPAEPGSRPRSVAISRTLPVSPFEARGPPVT